MSKVNKIQRDHFESEVQHFFRFLLRFTYVKQFAYKPGEGISDVNWGCTLRTGQMVISNMLLFKTKYDQNQSTDWNNLTLQNAETCFQIFRQDQLLHFSSLFEIGRCNFKNKVPEVFWTSVEFLQAFKLTLTQKKNELPDQLKGLHVINTISYFSFEEIERELKTHQRILLGCSVCLGKHKCDPKYQTELKFLMRLQPFAGLMAAQEKRSYYVFGFDYAHYYYLDPHAVSSQKADNELNEHFIKSFFTIDFNSFNPFMTFVFLIDSDNIKEFKEQITSSQNKREVIFIGEEEEFDGESSARVELDKFNDEASRCSELDSFPTDLVSDENTNNDTEWADRSTVISYLQNELNRDSQNLEILPSVLSAGPPQIITPVLDRYSYSTLDNPENDPYEDIARGRHRSSFEFIDLDKIQMKEADPDNIFVIEENRCFVVEDKNQKVESPENKKKATVLSPKRSKSVFSKILGFLKN